MDKKKIISIIKEYYEIYPHEKSSLWEKLLASEVSIFSRKNKTGHITASAILLSADCTKILLVRHKFLQKLLQPGGHVDENETTLEASKRELSEETGLTDFEYIKYSDENELLPLDIDIHAIPISPKKNEEAHYHYDFRYLYFMKSDEKTIQNETELDDLEWFEIDKIEKNMDIDDNLKRTIRKAQRALEQKNDSRFFSNLLKDLDLNLQKNLQITLVSHIVPDLIEFVKILEKITTNIVIIPKPNSIKKEIIESSIIKNKIKKYSGEELNYVNLLEIVLSKDYKNIIIDIGGYFANDALISFQNKYQNILGIIEDTENGLQKYENLTNKNFKICSVARSILKKNEDDLVGYSVGFFTEYIMRENSILPRYKTCAIIGYGKVGKGVAKYLFNQNIKPLIYDTNPVLMIEAYKDGCICANKFDLLSKSDLIFCCTGNKSLSPDDFSTLNNGAYIASVTSSDNEFDFGKIFDKFKSKKINDSISYISNGKNYFYLINNGNAVNFLSGDRVGNFIRLVQGEIIALISNIISKNDLNHSEHLRLQKIVATIFLQIYLNFQK